MFLLKSCKYNKRAKKFSYFKNETIYIKNGWLCINSEKKPAKKKTALLYKMF